MLLHELVRVLVRLCEHKVASEHAHDGADVKIVRLILLRGTGLQHRLPLEELTAGDVRGNVALAVGWLVDGDGVVGEVHAQDEVALRVDIREFVLLPGRNLRLVP